MIIAFGGQVAIVIDHGVYLRFRQLGIIITISQVGRYIGDIPPGYACKVPIVCNHGIHFGFGKLGIRIIQVGIQIDLGSHAVHGDGQDISRQLQVLDLVQGIGIGIVHQVGQGAQIHCAAVGNTQARSDK